MKRTATKKVSAKAVEVTAFEARSSAALKAWLTRRTPRYRASKSEQASKMALATWAAANGWRVVFFEGKTGAARTGIVDALLVRIRSGDADALEVRLVQLKSGAGGLTAAEVRRLKDALQKLRTDWLLAAFDGTQLHFVPGMIDANLGTVPNTALEPAARGPVAESGRGSARMR